MGRWVRIRIKAHGARAVESDCDGVGFEGPSAKEPTGSL